MDYQTEMSQQKPPELVNEIPSVSSSSKSKLPLVLVMMLLLSGFIGIGIVLGKVLFTSSTTPSVEKLVLPTPTVSQTIIIPTATTDLTTNWKTYTNSKHGYSVKYPPTFEIVEGPVPESELPTLDSISFGGMKKSSDSYAGVGFDISVNPSDANGKLIPCTTNDDCSEKLLTVLNKSSGEVTNITNTIMGKSVKGFEYQNKNSLYVQTNQYFIYPNNGKIWQVSITMNNYTAQEVANITNQILSTFKFTGQNQTSDTTGWKTYTEGPGLFGTISVKYPSDWSATKSTHSGHPNYATFSRGDNTSCVQMSVSSDEATLDQELKNGATNWDSSKQDNTVINGSNLTVNGQQAIERTVMRDTKEFMDGAVYLGIDPRYSTNKVYAYLSSCGMKEADIFNSILSGLTIK